VGVLNDSFPLIRFTVRVLCTGLGSRSARSRILFFLQVPEWEPEHFKKLKWSRSCWSRSWHKLVRLQQFLKIL